MRTGGTITTLVFDIHGVFLLESESMFEGLARDFGIGKADLDRILFAGGAWNDFKRGHITEDEYWNEAVASFPSAFMGDSVALRYRLDTALLLNQALVDLVRELGPKYRVAALSNAGSELERRLEHHRITELFELVINSHRVGMAKPDESIYQLTLERLGVAPEEVLFVDDKERNTLVADKLGFNTHIYTDFESFAKVIQSLR